MGRSYRLGLVLSLSALVLAVPRSAHAFEDMWHLGLGAGVGVPTGAYDTAAALSVYGAYGISDVFDVRLNATGLLLHPSAETGSKNSLTVGTLGLVYKLDVIEWIPYAGVRAGGFAYGDKPADDTAQFGGTVGFVGGIDYSFARSAAVGVEVADDFLLPGGRLFSALLHAEYRWGF